jgi:hypothetical protein
MWNLYIQSEMIIRYLLEENSVSYQTTVQSLSNGTEQGV